MPLVYCSSKQRLRLLQLRLLQLRLLHLLQLHFTGLAGTGTVHQQQQQQQCHILLLLMLLFCHWPFSWPGRQAMGRPLLLQSGPGMQQQPDARAWVLPTLSPLQQQPGIVQHTVATAAAAVTICEGTSQLQPPHAQPAAPQQNQHWWRHGQQWRPCSAPTTTTSSSLQHSHSP